MRFCFLLVLLSLFSQAAISSSCDAKGLWLQVLGSGGPESDDGRASSSYLVWHDGKAKVLVDIGGGAHWRFEQSGASFNDLDAVLFSHLHVDHSADFPALIKSGFFHQRERDLAVIGPSGNEYLPSTENFVERLLSVEEGAWPYLGNFLNGKDSYQVQTESVDFQISGPLVAFESENLRLLAIGVEHGPLPALAWKIEIDNKSIVISGDMNGQRGTLEKLAKNADLLVAHHAISEETYGAGRQLHMPPSLIAEIAAISKPKQLVLSHLMKRSLAELESSQKIISEQYTNTVSVANDLDCFLVGG